ncbi:MAG: DUF3793 family protein [Clostridiales bacterium]|nr:MAG: DUF3793 family protein [Clostridiales bacterium]
MIVYRKKTCWISICTKAQTARFFRITAMQKDGNFDDYVNTLKSRLDGDSFPHEIGVFFWDILCVIYIAFINHRNEGCKLVGEWKVYHNAEEAKKTFSRFKACRKALFFAALRKEAEHLHRFFCAA